MSETIRIDDMKLFASVVGSGSMTEAARALGLPKQSVSRRIADLERALGLKLLHRTVRRVTPTEHGLAYAERCAEIVRLADEANRAVGDRGEEPTGTLRISADPTFGEAFLSELVIAFARRWPNVAIDVRLSRRRVDVVREGFDVAFRVGPVDDATLTGLELAPAEVRYCASPTYVAARGEPTTPRELARHDCIVVGHDEGPVRWPFRAGRARGVRAVAIDGRLRTSSFAMSLACARGARDRDHPRVRMSRRPRGGSARLGARSTPRVGRQRLAPPPDARFRDAARARVRGAGAGALREGVDRASARAMTARSVGGGV